MSRTARLLWLWRRLRVMSPAEIAHRIGRVMRRLLPGAHRWPDATDPNIIAARQGQFLGSAERQLFHPPVVRDAADANLLLDGQVTCFDRWIPVRSGGQFWHTDPLSGVVWPRSGPIDYRPGNPHGDVRVIWEINRLQHLFGVALIAHDSTVHRERAIALIESQLLDWWQANPPGAGVNYLSAMEAALRLVSLCHAFDLARPWLRTPVRDILAAIVVSHATFIEGHLSLYSSAGNHTIAEAVGLLYAGTLFPECKAAGRWRGTGRRLLASESARQVLADGGGLEQATWYLLFITDLMGLAQELLRYADAPPVPELDAAIGRGRDFLQALAAAPRDLPRIGDADDGWALSPGLQLSWHGSATTPRQRSFPQAGLTVASFTGHDRLILLHNPLGMPPSCGHGHADALSVLFTLDGVDLLIDPGTGQYGGDPALRRYFRGSSGHNTATVGDADQALQLAPFMWARPYRCQLELAEFTADHVLLLARHDAWRKVGIMHWRAVSYRRGQYLAIHDWLDGPATASVRVRWHLGCPVEGDGSRFRLLPPQLEPLPLILSGGALRTVTGTREPLFGWQSRRYGEVIPCNMLEATLPTESPRRLLTVLRLDGVADPLQGHIADFPDLEKIIDRQRPP
ncbi:Heparin-sulfate lyase [Gammaproteobacteria bacterium]|nr:alginate lyase family protein [Gammaproteobacteria bacterium]CAG0938099.1 Heparin-sulfate lyase [Gammaproteobacteria bacterium]